MKYAKILIIIPVISIIFSTPVQAKSAREKWWERYNYMQEYTMEIYNDEDLYSNYTPHEEIASENKTTKKTKKNTSKTTTRSEAKGWVYGVDELHVTGLPEDERGYTKAGDYGVIEKK